MSEEKKIIVDEDWKAQVEREKETQQKGAETDQGEAAAGDEAGTKFPPASFEMLVSMFATDAMMALGQIPHPMTNSVEQNLDQAKYVIDLLAVIQEKTDGNLTDQESVGLQNLIHQLRMAYVEISKQTG